MHVRQIQSYWSKGHESCWKDGAMDCVLINMIINKIAVHLNMDPIAVQIINDGLLNGGIEIAGCEKAVECGLIQMVYRHDSSTPVCECWSNPKLIAPRTVNRLSARLPGYSSGY